ncbi:MAG: dihydrofolate reductase family protein [Ignavibacteria bacterium]|nr:dihydrofolate reductase family protein [Ignavibacteria bacterium]
MRNIIYYVASSIDGYIAGPKGEVTRFIFNGSGVDKYLADLAGYDTVLMGRNTYEFGYNYGLAPGQPVYPHMEHYIFSNTLYLDKHHSKIHVTPVDLREVDMIKNSGGTDIYLCGGGKLAGWLLAHRKIDYLKLKLNPIILGAGVPLFGTVETGYRLDLIAAESHDHGMQVLTYKFIY